MSGIMSMVLGAKTAIAAAVDAYFNLVTLLLPGDGTNGAQNNTFLDSSTNNFTITRNGNTTQGTFSPFSQTGWSNYFDGSGDYITASNSTAFNMGSGDFTVECWIYTTNASATTPFITTAETADFHGLFLGMISGQFCLLADDGTSPAWSVNITAGTVVANTWTHVAGVRNGNVFTLYVNGSSVGTQTLSITLTNANNLIAIGGRSTSTQYFTGYISNARVVKGTAVYTSNFTVSTTPLTAVTNTSLLTCQSNRFVDNSTNAFAITRNGDVSVQAFSPFAPTAAYSAATNGGSGYFDGTGDYLSLTGGVTDNGTGDLTLEFWSYYTGSYSAEAVAFDSRVSPFTNGFAITSAATSGYWTMNFASQDILTSTAAAKNAWEHIVVTRSGNTFRLFVNGILRGTVSSTNNMSNNTNKIGASYNNGGAWPGYIAGLRAIKGSIPTDYQTSSTTVGTSIFTPPTAPPTAVTNTSLLCNFTNAGITDATAKNVLETVGNAQISTTQSKFGGSSMYFDGTGDYLLIPSSNVNRPLFDFGSGNWTVEFWVNWTTAPSATTEFRLWWSSVRSTGVARLDLYIYNNIVYAGWSGTNVLDSGSLSWNTGQWYHMAFVRSGNSWAAFRDGTRIASATNSTTLVSSPAKIIGENVNAYIDDFRVTAGYARYDPSQTTVTIPTAAFGLQ